MSGKDRHVYLFLAVTRTGSETGDSTTNTLTVSVLCHRRDPVLADGLFIERARGEIYSEVQKARAPDQEGINPFQRLEGDPVFLTQQEKQESCTRKKTRESIAKASVTTWSLAEILMVTEG